MVIRPHPRATFGALATRPYPRAIFAAVAIRPYLLAACAVLPLLAPEVWDGFRLGVSDPVLGVLAVTEQPLSVRSPGGLWAAGLALTWFGLAYWRRQLGWWEAALVLIGGAAALARLGNAWVDAAAMLVPLARQIQGVRRLTPAPQAVAGVICLAVAVFTLLITRPPDLAPGAALAVQALNNQAPQPVGGPSLQPAAGGPILPSVVGRQTPEVNGTRGTVLADWRWAAQVQRQLGSRRTVLAAGGLASEPSEFWLDYLRIVQGHERWAELLSQMQVDLLVLNSTDQQQTAALVRASTEWRVLYDAAGALVAQRVPG